MSTSDKIYASLAGYAQDFRLNNTYGVARSFIALSTLLTFLLNDISRLVSPYGFAAEDMYRLSWISRISLFYLLGDHLLPARIIAIAILLVVISGWRPRYTGILHWWITFSFSTSSQILEGGDQIAEIVTLLLIPLTLADHRRFVWTNDIKPRLTKNASIQDLMILFIGSTLLIINLQVSFIYFHACVGKFSTDEWVNGTAVYYWFDNTVFGLPDWQRKLIFPLIGNPYIVTTATWGALLLEISLAAGIFIRRPAIRRLLLVLGVSFHLFIGVFFGLWTFLITMTGVLILYLGPVKGFGLQFVRPQKQLKLQHT